MRLFRLIEMKKTGGVKRATGKVVGECQAKSPLEAKRIFAERLRGDYTLTDGIKKYIISI